jgi:hypothetical protein
MNYLLRPKRNIYCKVGKVTLLLMSNGSALLDTDRVNQVKDFQWFRSKRQNPRGYVEAHAKGTGKMVYMHRLLLDTPPGLDTDHVNRNGLCNKLENLRVATRSQNNLNRSKANSSSSTGVLGVVYRPKRKKYEANVFVNGVGHYCGQYRTVEEAVEARKIKLESLLQATA